MEKQKSFYEQDFAAWAFSQAENLRKKDYGSLDMENLIEEIETMGRSEKQRLISYLTLTFMHLLKWIYQPERRGSSWKKSIFIGRDGIKECIEESPSLKNCFYDCVKKAYQKSIYEAMIETELPEETFPEKMPFTLEQALAEDWLP